MAKVRPRGTGTPVCCSRRRVASLWVHRPRETALDNGDRLHRKHSGVPTPSVARNAPLEYRVVDRPHMSASRSSTDPLAPSAPSGAR